MPSQEMATENNMKESVASATKRYFVAKCFTIDSLKSCQRSSLWACKIRNNPPQPKDILTEAFNSCTEVILVFSVNNCSGWHGYATMVTAPESSSTCDEGTRPSGIQDSASCNRSPFLEGIWYTFKIKWKTLFLDEFGEQCLSFRDTKDLVTTDPLVGVNQARNFDELSLKSGSQICQLIDSQFSTFVALKNDKLQNQLDQRPRQFLDIADIHQSIDQLWKAVLQKVGKLGQILVACPFGSHRYNLATPDSDTDMFVVYAAHTSDLLGFSPPPHTIKNQDTEFQDYTILEVRRYCELLMSGDPRCVETLFLDSSVVYHESKQMAALRKDRGHFLNKLCLEKYLRDATGARGLKQIEKIHKGSSTKGSTKLNKLFYIVIRLLQNARNIAMKEDLTVFRPYGSKDRDLLMSVRKGEFGYEDMKIMTDRMIEDIQGYQIIDEHVDFGFLEQWLLDIRYKDFVSLYTPP